MWRSASAQTWGLEAQPHALPSSQKPGARAETGSTSVQQPGLLGGVGMPV